MLSLSAILLDSPPDSELRKFVARALNSWRTTLGLQFVDLGTQQREPTVKVDVWAEESNPDVEVELVSDDAFGRSYLSVVAPDEPTRRKIYNQLRHDFKTASVEQLQEDVRRSGETDPASYLRLALGSNGVFDEISYALIRKGLQLPQVAVRAQAALAAGLVYWPQLATDLEEALAKETDEGVKRLMAAAERLSREGRL